MSYQVIARKWRPNTFEEVTGQEAITRTLRNAIEHERLHHAYLFSGARGVGKTTTARLLAKALNCHKTPKPNPRPCSPNDNEPMCASCKEIAEGRSIDVLEIDAASNTGVDNVREVIINNLGISPARDRYKVFIIDEVHMLSTSSFNALLKSVEEPPPQVVFIMATTELHKVPDTILSRCQEFEFRTIATVKIFERLKLIAEAEKIQVNNDALREIARAGEGSMRDAQSAFDQVISFSGERIAIEDVTTALGIASAEMLARAVGAISSNKPLEALEIVEELNRRGQDLRNFCRDLLSHFRDLLVAKIAGGADDLLDSAVMSREELSNQARDFSEADLIRFFNSLSDTETQLRAATQPRYILEIGLIKLIEMRRVAPLEKILERLANLEQSLAGSDSINASDIKSEIQLAEEVSAPEKKTLKVDFPLSDVPFPVEGVTFSQAPPTESFSTSIPEPAAAPDTETETFPVAAPFEEPKDFSFEANRFVSNFSNAEPPAFSAANFLDSAPVKLLPITSEELEHIEDNWLDTAFEEKLLREGDDLNVLKSACLLAEKLLGANGFAEKVFSPVETLSSNGTAAFAPAKTFNSQAFIPPAFDETEVSDEMPVLPENPTEEDLWRYAENHPKIKMALRIFRGKLIKVSKIEEQASG